MLHMPSPAASRNTLANGSLIRGASDALSAARAAATPSAFVPTLSLMFQESSSALGMLKPSHPDAAPTLDRRGHSVGVSEPQIVGPVRPCVGDRDARLRRRRPPRAGPRNPARGTDRC